MDILALKKTLWKKLIKDLFYISIIPNKLNTKVYSLINAINIAMTLVIFKARLSLKSELIFDKEYKKIWKKEEIKED